MFKNNVFNVSVNTQKWMKAAAIRAVKTFAQTGGAMITVGAAMNEVAWGHILSVSLVAGIASVFTSIAGIPEVKKEGE